VLTAVFFSLFEETTGVLLMHYRRGEIVLQIIEFKLDWIYMPVRKGLVKEKSVWIMVEHNFSLRRSMPLQRRLNRASKMAITGTCA
jgi:hypothetical protein